MALGVGAGFVGARWAAGRTSGTPGRAGSAIQESSPQPTAKDGEGLYRRLACWTCHELPGAGKGVNVPPSLEIAGSRSPRAWIEAYLRRPYRIRFAEDGVRPSLVMPDFQLTDDQARALALFLSERRDPERIPEQLPGALDDPALVAQGRDLAEDYQCRGCHRIGGEGAQIGPHLDGVGERRRPEYLFALLMDPDRIIPGTPMKDFKLWEEEALAIVAYLRSLRPPARGAIVGAEAH